MPTSQELAEHLSKAITENFVNDVLMEIRVEDADPIEAQLIRAADPNWQEHSNLIFALLRYPEALEAVKLLNGVSRLQLARLLGNSMEFIEIVNELNKE